MISRKHINPYKSKLKGKKFEYITPAGSYTTTHDVKVPFSMIEFSIRKFIMHCFHLYNPFGDERIGYDMIIGCDLMV